MNKQNCKALADLRAMLPVVGEPPDPFEFIALSLVAYHLGGWRRDTIQSVVEHYCRGAEWPTVAAMQSALANDLDAWNDKHQAALRKMFGARGHDLETGSPDAMRVVFVQLIDEADKADMPLEMG